MVAPLITARRPLGLLPDQPVPWLFDRIIEVLRGRHYSRRTEEACLHWVRRLVQFHERRHLRLRAEREVNFFLHI